MLPQKIFCGIFLLVVLSGIVYGQDEGEVEDPADGQRSCFKYNFDFIQTSILVILKCVGEKFKPKNLGEYVTRSFCILKCVVQELGAIGQDGLFDDISAAFFFEENFADEVKNGLLPNVQECFGLTDQFNPKDYYCKSYAPFIICVLKNLLNELLPYIVRCFGNPVIAIFLDVLKAWAPDPVIQKDVEDLQRVYMQKKTIKCYNKDCSQKYKIEKTGNQTIFVLYDKNMTEIKRSPKKVNEGATVFK